MTAVKLVSILSLIRNEIWLSQLNWDSKKLRKKGKSQRAMDDLIKKLSPDSTVEKYIISSLTPKKELVHLPCFPK